MPVALRIIFAFAAMKIFCLLHKASIAYKYKEMKLEDYQLENVPIPKKCLCSQTYLIALTM